MIRTIPLVAATLLSVKNELKSYRNYSDEQKSAHDTSKTFATRRIPSIICVGAAGIDAVGMISSFPKPDDKIRTSSLTLAGGGNAANTCSAISKLGITASIFSRVGADVNGQLVISQLQADGVQTDLIDIAPNDCPTMFTFVMVDASTSSRTCISTVIKEELSPAAAHSLAQRFHNFNPSSSSTALVHFDSRHTAAALQLAQEITTANGPILTIDVEKDRPPHLHNLLPLCHIVFSNEHFASNYLPSTTLQSGILSCILYPDRTPTSSKHCNQSLDERRELLELDGDEESGEILMKKVMTLRQLFRNSQARVVVSTMGAKGCVLLRRRVYSIGDEKTSLMAMLRSRIPAIIRSDGDETTQEIDLQALKKVEKQLFVHRKYLLQDGDEEFDVLRLSASKVTPSDQIVDTTGAGDAFIGGFLVALLAQQQQLLSFQHQKETENEAEDELVLMLRCAEVGSLVAAVSLRGLGARAAQPTVKQLNSLLRGS
mmetsp:Transcript_12274/g.18410  ORF Transcript_12274/g.18410 Transcript_12274/m.18410 type:complete len:487 (-) Transcript_12274:63-1523(-)